MEFCCDRTNDEKGNSVGDKVHNRELVILASCLSGLITSFVYATAHLLEESYRAVYYLELWDRLRDLRFVECYDDTLEICGMSTTDVTTVPDDLRNLLLLLIRRVITFNSISFSKTYFLNIVNLGTFDNF